VLPNGVKLLGEMPETPGTASSMRVPAVVPSLTHNSEPLAAATALKNSLASACTDVWPAAKLPRALLSTRIWLTLPSAAASRSVSRPSPVYRVTATAPGARPRAVKAVLTAACRSVARLSSDVLFSNVKKRSGTDSTCVPPSLVTSSSCVATDFGGMPLVTMSPCAGRVPSIWPTVSDTSLPLNPRLVVLIATSPTIVGSTSATNCSTEGLPMTASTPMALGSKPYSGNWAARVALMSYTRSSIVSFSLVGGIRNSSVWVSPPR